MLVFQDQAHHDRVVAFARRVGAEAALQKALEYLRTYACDRDPKATRCILRADEAPYSYVFVMERRAGDGYTTWFHGGLIYSGPGQKLDGTWPAYCVSLDPAEASGDAHRWSVHT